MILKVFAIFDSKVQAYAHPFYGRTTGEGVRAFENIFTSTNPQHQDSDFQKHPEDFSLYEIGEYDDQSGLITPVPHISLAKGNNFIS